MGKPPMLFVSLLLATCLGFSVQIAEAAPKGKKSSSKSADGNNGHGNDSSGVDPSNPGKGSQKSPKKPSSGKPKPPKAGDGNNGHGNDSSGIDPSNPGQGGSQGGGNTVDDILGNIVKPGAGTGSNANLPSVAPILPEPTTDPFEGLGGTTTGSSPIPPTNTDVGGGSDGPAYGSIPLIRDDAPSINYLLGQLIADAQKSALARGETPHSTQAMEKAYNSYARKLAKTLSKLTQEQQNLVFYGRK